LGRRLLLLLLSVATSTEPERAHRPLSSHEMARRAVLPACHESMTAWITPPQAAHGSAEAVAVLPLDLALDVAVADLPTAVALLL
jgi:hypothetical protein